MRSVVNDNNFGTFSSQLKDNLVTLKREKEKWQASSWVMTLLEWYRSTAWRSIYQQPKS